MRRSAAALATALAAVGCAAPPAPLGLEVPGAQEEGRIQRAIADDPYVRGLRARSVLDSFVGSRSLDAGEAWSPIDDQVEVGISWQPPLLIDDRSGRSLLDDALAWDFGIRFAYDEADLPGPGGNDVLRSRTYDLSGGLILDAGRNDLVVSPYVGAGMALLFTNIERAGPDVPFEESDSVVAGYVRGGARLRLDGRSHVGVDVRWLLGADDAIDGVGASADAVTVSFLMGVRF
ncbi:MAG: hypothetical protein VX015_14865 [Planctomycetota bacterium]|nr:hypothetical protein [Planctomycetota bacterium]MEC8513423.1 hypothetical protein [Planctomycetota bacterium]